jgi:hypothetical protein
MNDQPKQTPWELYLENLKNTPEETFEPTNPGFQRPARPWDLFNKKIGKVEDELASERLAICKDCPRIRKSSMVCKECGCFMPAKVKLPNAFCPIGKWQSIVEEPQIVEEDLKDEE